MAGLIFFWRGGGKPCVPFSPVLPEFEEVGYAEKVLVDVASFAAVWNSDLADYAPIQPAISGVYAERFSEETKYQRRLPPPVCKHD